MAEPTAVRVAAGPIERRRTYELVAERLLTLITSGALSPGSPLPTERELAAAYAVGRSSVREALRMLESQGVVVPAGGALVVANGARPLERSLRLVMSLRMVPGTAELFELRRIIECEAAALAARRHRPEQLQRMDAAAAAMAAALSARDADAYVDADVGFHLAVSAAAGNPLVADTMEAVRDTLRRVLAPIFAIPQSGERAIAEHRDIRAAIAAGDAGAARDAMRAHLDRVAGDLPDAEPGP